jgi:hypothetical protein
MDTSPLTEDGQDDDFGFEWDSDSCGARRQDSTSYPGEEGTWDPRHSGRASESGQRAWRRLRVGVPSCVAHYTQGLGGVLLVTPWYSQLPKSKVTLKALTQELLMVGCTAGTIKNVWCRISDRHRRFGHNAPLSAAGDFKRLCKAVAAVKGAPQSFLFPSAVTTTCGFLDLTGLTECQARDVLVCATRMALCGRVVEVTDFCG